MYLQGSKLIKQELILCTRVMPRAQGPFFTAHQLQYKTEVNSAPLILDNS